MAENFDSELFTLTDEDGKAQDFELLDQMEVNGEMYYAFVPYYESPEADEEDVDGELVVLKMEEDEDGEESLITIDDDDEYARIGQMFLERLQDMYES